MKIPCITGIIDRRMLINFTIDLEVAKTIVPAPFTPKNYKGKAIAGICLIRLKQVRPKGFPSFIGVGSENGAHRIAVEWMENGQLKEGVYIPRRDTSSAFNAILGGRVFPGKHHHANFDVKEELGNFYLSFESSDATSIAIQAKVTDKFNSHSIFSDLSEASEFFQAGSIGYSPNGNKFDGLHLYTYKWEVQPLAVTAIHSSFFEDKAIFPEGSAIFDNALLMTNIKHDWTSVADKY